MNLTPCSLRHDRLPEALDELVPDFVASIPDDPMTGKAVAYRRLDPGFLVYGVGEDGVAAGAWSTQGGRRGAMEGGTSTSRWAGESGTGSPGFEDKVSGSESGRRKQGVRFVVGLKRGRGRASQADHPGVASAVMDDFPDAESTPAWSARRATIEDLPALSDLWHGAGLPSGDLERYLTEFQVVSDEGGVVRAAVGLQVDGDQGLLHSEVVSVADDEADACRAALWTRIQVVARNLGAVRLWTLEDAPYWRSIFRKAPAAEVESLEAAFADPEAGWWMLPLVDVNRLEQMAQKQAVLRGDLDAGRGDEAFQETIRRVKVVAYSLAGLVILLLVAFAVYVLMHREVLQRALQTAP